MANTIQVKSALPKQPDGGFKVAIFDRDDRYKAENEGEVDGELFIADDKVHNVVPTAAVRAAMVDGRLKEVRAGEDPDAEDDDESEESKSLAQLMAMTREELDDAAEVEGVDNAQSMKTKEEVARAIIAKRG